MRRAAARYSCSGGLADDRPMSGLRLIASGDSLLNYNVAVSIVVQLYSCCYQFKCQICLTYPCATSEVDPVSIPYERLAPIRLK